MAHRVDKTTGKVIRRLRERAGLTQEVLAERIGVSYQQIQKYETGANRVSTSRLFDIARGLKNKPHVIVQLVEFELDNEGDLT